jgi:hypothetical protein
VALEVDVLADTVIFVLLILVIFRRFKYFSSELFSHLRVHALVVCATFGIMFSDVPPSASSKRRARLRLEWARRAHLDSLALKLFLSNSFFESKRITVKLDECIQFVPFVVHASSGEFPGIWSSPEWSAENHFDVHLSEVLDCSASDLSPGALTMAKISDHETDVLVVGQHVGFPTALDFQDDLRHARQRSLERDFGLGVVVVPDPLCLEVQCAVESASSSCLGAVGPGVVAESASSCLEVQYRKFESERFPDNALAVQGALESATLCLESDLSCREPGSDKLPLVVGAAGPDSSCVEALVGAMLVDSLVLGGSVSDEAVFRHVCEDATRDPAHDVVEGADCVAPDNVVSRGDCPVFREYKSFDLVLSGVTCSCSRCADFEEFWMAIIKCCHKLGVSADCSDSNLHNFEMEVCLALAKSEGFASDLRMISRSELYCDLVAQIIGGAVGEVMRMLADCPRTNEGYVKRSKIWEFFVQMVCDAILDCMRKCG